MTEPPKLDPTLATKLAQVLDQVRVKTRHAPRSGKKSVEGWKVIGVSLPPDIVAELDRVAGRPEGGVKRGRGHHIERAVRLYLWLLGCGEKWLRGDKGNE